MTEIFCNPSMTQVQKSYAYSFSEEKTTGIRPFNPSFMISGLEGEKGEDSRGDFKF